MSQVVGGAVSLVRAGGLWSLACASAALVGYLALFSWDQERDFDGSETSGPYSWWQVGLLVLALLAVTRGAVNAHSSVAPVLTIPPVLTISFWQDWASTDDSGLYMVGVLLLAIGSFLGTLLTVWLMRSNRDLREHLAHVAIGERQERRRKNLTESADYQLVRRLVQLLPSERPVILELLESGEPEMSVERLIEDLTEHDVVVPSVDLDAFIALADRLGERAGHEEHFAHLRRIAPAGH